MGGLEKISSPDDVRDSLQTIVVNDGKMITGADVFSNDHRIAEELGAGRLLAFLRVEPGRQIADPIQCGRQIETEGKVGTGSHFFRSLLLAQISTGSWIHGTLAAMGGSACVFDFSENLLSGAKTRIEQALLAKALGSSLVVFEVLALDTDRLFPIESQPSQVIENLLGVFRITAVEVDVFNPEEEAALGFPRKLKSLECGKSVAFVQVAGRAGGESGHRCGIRHCGIIEQKLVLRNL